MNRSATGVFRFITQLTATAGIVWSMHSPLVRAENIQEQAICQLPLESRIQEGNGAYILGPGDGLQIELLDLPEFSGLFSIGPDGSLYLPRLRNLQAEGLTVEELRCLLTEKFGSYVHNPQVYVRPVAYRQISVYVGGEVKRSGYYTLSGVQVNQEEVNNITRTSRSRGASPFSRDIEKAITSLGNGRTSSTVFPTVFDAIRIAQGITPFSDLSQVEVIRKRAPGLGGGKVRTSLNILALLTDGDESQNIRLFDGDVVKISKSDYVLRDQLLKASQSNLTPQFLRVYVAGRVENPGSVTLPQGSALNQALLISGVKFIKGRIEFVRFNKEGTVDRRIFSHKPNAAIDAHNNPILEAGDVINVRDSLITGSVNVLNEITQPVISTYSVYTLFNGILQ